MSGITSLLTIIDKLNGDLPQTDDQKLVLGLFIQEVVAPKQSDSQHACQNVLYKSMVYGIKYLKYDYRSNETFHFEFKDCLPAIGFDQSYVIKIYENIIASGYKYDVIVTKTNKEKI